MNELQREAIKRSIKEAEEDTSDKYYFETIGYYEEKLKRLEKQEIEALKKWKIINAMTEEQIKKIHVYKRFKDEILYSEREINGSKYEYKGIISEEYKREEREQAKLSTYKLLNGAFGKRQKMEISQTLLNENI